MIKPVSSASSTIYRRVAKPAMFTQPPDKVHSNLLKLGKFVGKHSTLRWLLSTSWAYQSPKILGQTVNGVHFDNPVGLSAGFDKNFELPQLLKAVGFGFMEGGSLTYEACKGNPKPWFYRLPQSKSLVVNAGLANQGVNTILSRLQMYPKNTFNNFPLNISVAKTNSPQTANETDGINDYANSLHAIKKVGIGDLVTINISCPNAFGGEPFTTPRKLDRLLDQIDGINLPMPIFIKMPSDLTWTETNALLKIAAKHNVAGVTIGNLTKKREGISDHLPQHIPGGLSGKPTWERTNALIKQTYQNYGDRFTIIGVGGIFSAQDAYTKIKLGATLVELITGMIYEGPQLIGDINRGLVKLLQQDGFDHISQAIGKDS